MADTIEPGETPAGDQAPRSAKCVSAIVEAFLRWCKATKKLNTFKQYRSRLTPFVTKFAQRDFASLEPIEIDDWLLEVNHFPDGRAKAPDTRRITAIALMLLQQYAIDKRVIEKKIIDKLEKPAGRKRKRLPQASEIAALEKHSSTEFARILRAFCQSGARPNELARATFENWDRQRSMIVLKEHKTDATGEARLIAVGKKLLPILEEATAGRDSGPLFLTPRGRAWTSATLSQTFARSRQKAGLPDDLILYGMRHKYATELCRKKGIHAAKSSLGHRSIKTTEGYVHDDDNDLLAAQDAVGDELPVSKPSPDPEK